MKTFRADIPVWATVYIKAETKEEAELTLRSLQYEELQVEGPEDLPCELSPPATICGHLNKRITAGEVSLEEFD